MNCPKCNQPVEINPDNVLMKSTCMNLACEFYQQEINFINPDDIESHFWNNTYLIQITRFDIPFVINADYEQAALDEMIDYIEMNQWDGLLLDPNDSDDLEMIESDEYLSGGNHGRYLSTYNVHIERINS